MTEINIDNDILIEKLKQYPVIYDKSSNDYRDTRKRNNAWKEIAQELKVEVQTAQKRYNTIRTRLSKYLRDLKPPSGSGIDSIVIKQEFEKLRWLITHINHRSTVSNYSAGATASATATASQQSSVTSDELEVSCVSSIADVEENSSFSRAENLPPASTPTTRSPATTSTTNSNSASNSTGKYTSPA